MRGVGQVLIDCLISIQKTVGVKIKYDSPVRPACSPCFGAIEFPICAGITWSTPAEYQNPMETKMQWSAQAECEICDHILSHAFPLAGPDPV